jgi:hypothetical protein
MFDLMQNQRIERGGNVVDHDWFNNITQALQQLRTSISSDETIQIQITATGMSFSVDRYAVLPPALITTEDGTDGDIKAKAYDSDGTAQGDERIYKYWE